MRKGFTLIEVIFVLAFIGITMAIAVPRMRVTPMRKAKTTATQLARDLELVRARAQATKKAARVVFDVGGRSYVGYLDDDRDGTFNQSQQETDALRARGTVRLPADVTYGRGSAGAVPGDSAGGVVTFPNQRFEFSRHGTVEPLGASGTIYLVHRDDPTAVAAVSVYPSGSIKAWVYTPGGWQ